MEWDYDLMRYGFVANFGVAAFLAVAAYIAMTRLRVPGRGFLATYLALVSANYGLESVGIVMNNEFVRSVGIMVAALDPPMLTAFALAFASWRLSRGVWVLLWAPSALFVLEGILVLARGAPSVRDALSHVMLPILGGHYALALVIIAIAHHRARTPVERDLRASLLPLIALIVVPRLPLLWSDARLIPRYNLTSLIFYEGALLLLTGLAVAIFLATAPADARRSARRVVRNSLGLIAVVLAVWLLRFAPGFAIASFGIFYSIRWVVFAGVLAVDAQRQRFLGLPASVAAPSRFAFVALLGFVGIIEISGLLASLPDATPAGAIVGATVFMGTIIAGGVAFARHRLADEETRVAKRRVYRAHIELGADEAALEGFRARLGLDPADAAEEARLARAAREVPADGLDRPEPGRTFARRYDVERLHGSGSFGLVYAGQDTVTRAKVVLKELRPDWRASAEAVSRFRHEAEVALRVSHPNLVRLLAIERASGGDVLVFERVEGEPLGERARRAPRLSGSSVAAIARDVLGALGALHAAGLVHRDVTPQNILVRSDGSAVLLDLGAAGTGAPQATRLAGAHPGTPAFMSPEQARGSELTPASDLYSMGLVLRALLGPNPSAAWRAPLEKALQEDPAQRWRDAGEFADALPR